jgi:hypothetical protein
VELNCFSHSYIFKETRKEEIRQDLSEAERIGPERKGLERIGDEGIGGD